MASDQFNKTLVIPPDDSAESSYPAISRTRRQYEMSLKQGDHSIVIYPTTSGVSGTQYRGEWEDDQKHGYGVQTYKGGKQKYEGQWQAGKREGEGVLWLINGKQIRKSYIGLWSDGARHGKGTAFYPDGQSYQGEWQKNQRHGEGQMTFKDRSVYSGCWYENEPSGYGHLKKQNGDTYEGFWVKGRREGAGSYFYNSSGKVFIGEWANDQPVAGVYQQAVKNKAEPGKLPVTTTIPPIEVENPDKVVENALNEVRQGRLFYRAINTPIEKLYTPQEIDQLREIYEARLVDRGCDIKALKNMLSTINITISEGELTNLVNSFNLYSELGSVTALGIAAVSGNAEDIDAATAAKDDSRSTNLSFANFARIVAVIVDQESRKKNRIQPKTYA